VSALATCSSQARECERRAELDEEEEEPKAKRLCGDSLEAARLDGDSPVAVKEAAAVADPDSEETAAVRLRQGTGGGQASAEVAQSTNLKRARNVGSLQFPPFPMWFLLSMADCCSIMWYNLQLAVSMASRASALARELKNIKSELHFMQERCGLLEEENKRLREGHDSGVAPEEDDLVMME
jgi:hypothetical protein